MSVQAHGFIRDYDPATDTATIELTGIGAIDTWISGTKVHLALPRGGLSGGIPCVIEMPDVHRICEAHVISLGDTTVTTQVGAGTQKTQTLRVVFTGGTAGTVTWVPAFTSAPTEVTASADSGISVTVSAVTNTGCTLTVGGSATQNYKITVTAKGV